MKKSLLQNLSFNSFDITENLAETLEQLKNTETMSDTLQISTNNNNSTFQIGLQAPEGMRWDLYGNPEIVEY